MKDLNTLERLPMTLGYFRLVLRCFGDTPEKRRALLARTGVSEKQLRDPNSEITLFQQVQQIENATRLLGEGWALSSPELWHHSSHGAIGSAALNAPTIGVALDTIRHYGHVRAPYYRAEMRRQKLSASLKFALTAALEEAQWRPMMEISFVGIRSLLNAVLGKVAGQANYLFACKAPSYAHKVRAALGERVQFGAPYNAVTIPASWLSIESPFSDPALFASAISELRRAQKHIENPVDLRARVEQLLQTMPEGRLTADAAARIIGVSRRTLVRRLDQANSGFRDLLDAEIKRRAARLLKSSKLSHAQIAEQLGYKDATSFSRACRRWFGTKRTAP